MILSEKIFSEYNGLIYYKLHFETQTKNDITYEQHCEIMDLIENYLLNIKND